MVRDALRAIGEQVSKNGAVTLSAGLDSRFLLSMITKDELLDVQGINLSSGPNVNRLIAEQVARTLNVAISSFERPKDHYSAILMNGHPEIGTNVCLRDAHFANGVLGKLPAHSVLIGGFMADPILTGQDTFGILRHAAFKSGVIDSSAPFWAVDRLYLRFCQADRQAIAERWKQAERLLDIGPEHSAPIRRLIPATRAGAKGQFEATRRSYPMYEPFMTQRAMELGLQMPSSIRSGNVKSVFYGHYLDATNGIPVNPSVSGLRKLQGRAAQVLLPKSVRPQRWIQQGEWREEKGALNKQAKSLQRSAARDLSEQLNVDLTDIRDKRLLSIVTTTVQALRRCITS